jgi:hypothetical protein
MNACVSSRERRLGFKLSAGQAASLVFAAGVFIQPADFQQRNIGCAMGSVVSPPLMMAANTLFVCNP